jgi:hypothetical protein
MTKTSTSVGSVIAQALSVAARVDLLALQGAAILLAVLAMGLFSILMGIGVLGLVLITGLSLVSVVILVVGIVLWLAGIIGISAFISGTQYHLVLQAISGKVIDFHQAWKLSSARWVDAFKLQCYIFTGIIILFLLAFAPAVLNILQNFPAGLLESVSNPASFLGMVGFSILALGILLILIWPFLILIPPTVYFEQAGPLQVIKRVKKYLAGTYWKVLGFGVLLLIVNSVISWIAELFSFSEMMNNAVASAPFLAFFLIGIAFIVQVLAVLYTTTFSLSAVSLLYLDVGKPKSHNKFVTTGVVSSAISKLALPKSSVQWKWPEKKSPKKPKRKLAKKKIASRKTPVKKKKK